MEQKKYKPESYLDDLNDVGIPSFEKYKFRRIVKFLLVLLMIRIFAFCFLALFTVFSVITPIFYHRFRSLEFKYIIVYILSSIFFILLDSFGYINLKIQNPKGKIYAIISSSAFIIGLLIFIASKSRIKADGQIILTCLFIFNFVIIALTFLTTQQLRTPKLAEPVFDFYENLPYENFEPYNPDTNSEIVDNPESDNQELT